MALREHQATRERRRPAHASHHRHQDPHSKIHRTRKPLRKIRFPQRQCHLLRVIPPGSRHLPTPRRSPREAPGSGRTAFHEAGEPSRLREILSPPRSFREKRPLRPRPRQYRSPGHHRSPPLDLRRIHRVSPHTRRHWKVLQSPRYRHFSLNRRNHPRPLHCLQGSLCRTELLSRLHHNTVTQRGFAYHLYQ